MRNLLKLTSLFLFVFSMQAQEKPITIEDELVNNRLNLYAVNKNLIDYDITVVIKGTGFKQRAGKPRLTRIPATSKVKVSSLVIERGKEPKYTYTVEANDSLQTYEIRAPISGIVVDSHANPGEFAGEQSLLTIANYERVWADLNVFPGEAQDIRAGQSVELRVGELVASSAIRFLNPGQGLSPSVIARVPLDNPDLTWTPGLLVEAEVTVDQFEVPLAIDNRALQTFRDWQVVFIKIGDEYEIRPLELGRSDSRFTEVLDGLNAGDSYVVENSYLLKADLEKSGASHDH